MATFTFTLPYSDDEILDFAKYIGYPETVDNYETDEVGNRTRTEVTNPQTPAEYIQAKATEHINKFSTQYAEYQKQLDMKATAEAVAKQYDEGVIADIKNSLVSTIE